MTPYDDPPLVRTFEMLVERLSLVEQKLDLQLTASRVAAASAEAGTVVAGDLFGWPGVRVRKCYSGYGGPRGLGTGLVLVYTGHAKDTISSKWANGETSAMCPAVEAAVGSRAAFERVKAEVVRRFSVGSTPSTCKELGLTGPIWDGAWFDTAAERLAATTKYAGREGITVLDAGSSYALLRIDDMRDESPSRCHLTEVLTTAKDLYTTIGVRLDLQPPIEVYHIPPELVPLVKNSAGRLSVIRGRREDFNRLTEKEIDTIRTYVAAADLEFTEKERKIMWSFTSRPLMTWFRS